MSETPRAAYDEAGDHIEVLWRADRSFVWEDFAGGVRLYTDLHTKEVIGLKVFCVRGLLRRAGFSVLPFDATPPKEAPVAQKSAADHLADCRAHLGNWFGYHDERFQPPSVRAVESLLAAVEALEARTRPAASPPPPGGDPAFSLPPTPKQRPEGYVGHYQAVFFDAAGTALSDYTATSLNSATSEARTRLSGRPSSYAIPNAAEARVYHRPSGALLWVHRRPAPEAPQ